MDIELLLEEWKALELARHKSYEPWGNEVHIFNSLALKGLLVPTDPNLRLRFKLTKLGIKYLEKK